MASTTISLYLVRHAVAEERGPDWPDDALRPLTERGARRFTAAAEGLVALEGAPQEIFTSPLVRARQTADLLAKAAGVKSVQVLDALAPEHDPADTLAALKKRWSADRVVAVGHEPDLGALAAYVLDVDLHLAFKKGGACRIDLPRGRKHGQAQLVWFVPPTVLRASRS